MDIHVKNPSTAQASANLIHCLLAAGGVAVIQLMIEHLHTGLSFCIAALALAPVIPLLLVERYRGPSSGP